MRLIHTGDWQIGKAFRFAEDDVMHALQAARLEAIRTLGECALKHEASTVLVAGDVFDKDDLSDQTLAKSLEAMRRFEKVSFHLLPGNHDPVTPNGIWHRLGLQGLPQNVILHLQSAMVPLQEQVILLPAPLSHRHMAKDPTAWMDQAATPEGAIRIGLAHGSVTSFGTSATPNLIAPDRARRAGLAFLGLGDWHGMKAIDARTWYAGTPEPDRFDQPDSGHALLVEVNGVHSPLQVTPLATGKYQWRRMRSTLHHADDIGILADRIRREHDDLGRLLLELEIEGTLSLAERQLFEQKICQGIGNAARFLRLKDDNLLIRPAPEDFDAMEGVVRIAAERLKVMSADLDDPSRDIAARALMRLYLETRKLGARQ